MNKKRYSILVMLLAVICSVSLLGAGSAEAAAKKVKLNKTKVSITVGKSKTLTLKNAKKSKVKWSSSNKTVATVNTKGKVAAKKTGKAVIKAKYKSKTYKCTVTVKPNKTASDSGDETSDDGNTQDEDASQNSKQENSGESNSGSNSNGDSSSENSNQNGTTVYLPATGSKYHSINNCGNMNPAKATAVTESEAIQRGDSKCSNCF